MEALGLNLGYLLVQIFNFLFVFVFLRALVYKPILGLLEKRRAKIAQGLEDARVATEARAHAEEEARSVIAKAQSEAVQKVREATERAEAASRDVMARADENASKAHEAALAEAVQERDHMLADLRSQVAALTIAATQKLVGEALDKKRQHVLIDEFFSGVKSGKVIVLEESDLQGEKAEIVSALPLTEDEKDTVRKDIAGKVGSKKVDFRVDPSILGGLVVKVGDKVVDGSVAGQLEALRQSLS